MRYILLIAVLALAASPAHARKNHSRHHHSHQTVLAYGQASYGETMLPHPAGCPARAFCGCGAAVEVFGSAIKSLWPAAAWFKFPHASPAPGMVGVRSHHVFVLRQHIEGSVWLVDDYNSGGHQSRRHARDISGYSTRNPHASNMAMR